VEQGFRKHGPGEELLLLLAMKSPFLLFGFGGKSKHEKRGKTLIVDSKKTPPRGDQNMITLVFGPVFCKTLRLTAFPNASLIGVGVPLDWIYNLPNIGIALLFGMAGACLLAGAPFLREKVLRIRVPSAHSEATDKALAVVTGFTGVVLAFSLVQASGNLRNLETQVATEAHNIDQMDRYILRYGDPANAAIRVALRDYAGSIVKDEWPELSKERSSERTTELFRPIARAILAIEPAPGRQSLIYAEMLKKVDEIAADRKARVVAAAKLELLSIFWQTIIALLVIQLFLATFSEANFGRAVALAGQGFGLALLVALVFMFDEPFKGQISVSPAPIVNVVAEMQTRAS
jgi:hypothetical protein